ncbi:MAG TPA: hypothetical protein VJB02_02865 [Coxiellaceae bacterium]|nr:hypothetical protein [Coxiellaceae bacterium]
MPTTQRNWRHWQNDKASTGEDREDYTYDKHQSRLSSKTSSSKKNNLIQKFILAFSLLFFGAAILLNNTFKWVPWSTFFPVSSNIEWWLITALVLLSAAMVVAGMAASIQAFYVHFIYNANQQPYSASLYLGEGPIRTIFLDGKTASSDKSADQYRLSRFRWSYLNPLGWVRYPSETLRLHVNKWYRWLGEVRETPVRGQTATRYFIERPRVLEYEEVPSVDPSTGHFRREVKNWAYTLVREISATELSGRPVHTSALKSSNGHLLLSDEAHQSAGKKGMYFYRRKVHQTGARQGQPVVEALKLTRTLATEWGLTFEEGTAIPDEPGMAMFNLPAYECVTLSVPSAFNTLFRALFFVVVLVPVNVVASLLQLIHKAPTQIGEWIGDFSKSMKAKWELRAGKEKGAAKVVVGNPLHPAAMQGRRPTPILTTLALGGPRGNPRRQVGGASAAAAAAPAGATAQKSATRSRRSALTSPPRRLSGRAPSTPYFSSP